MKKNEIAKAILLAIGAVGFITVAIAAPNLVSGLRRYQGIRKFDERRVKKSLSRLKYSKLISVIEKNDKLEVRLTKEGEEKVLRYKIEDLFIEKPKKWDRFWRFVIFDVPEKFKVNRDCFVRKIKDMGFIQLQRSVWVYPYPCEDQIIFLREAYNIGRFVRLITARSFEVPDGLTSKFKLSY